MLVTQFLLNNLIPLLNEDSMIGDYRIGIKTTHNKIFDTDIESIKGWLENPVDHYMFSFHIKGNDADFYYIYYNETTYTLDIFDDAKINKDWLVFYQSLLRKSKIENFLS